MTRLIIGLKNLVFPCLRVKLLSLAAASIFMLAHSLCAYAYPTEKYGEFVIRYALLWLPEYFGVHHEPDNAFFQEMEKIAREVRSRCIDESWLPKGDFYETHYSWKRNTLVRFLPESSGEFVIKGAPTTRVAVTGDAIDSEIIFNLDKISNRKTFTYEDALVFWVHEIGHKYIARHKLGGEKKREAQARIDDLASYIGKLFSSHAVVDSEPLIAFNGAPYGMWNSGWSLIQRLLKAREPNKLMLVDGENLTDLTPMLNRELDRWSGRRNSFQVRRHIRDIEIWKSEPGEVRAKLRLYVNRRTLHDNKPFQEDDMGTNFPHVAYVVLRDGALKVWHYPPDLPDLRRAEDAEIELPTFEIHADGTFSAEMHLTLATKQNFHAAGYPEREGAVLLFVVNGESVNVPVTMHADMKNPTWWAMPAELYQKPSLKRGWLKGTLPPGWRSGFEVMGMTDRFFELGTSRPAAALFVPMKRPLLRSKCDGEMRS